MELVLVELRKVRWDFVEEKEEKGKRGKGSIKGDKNGRLQIVKENADEKKILAHMENQPLISIGGCVMSNVFIEIVDMLYKGKHYLSKSCTCAYYCLFLYHIALKFNAVLYFFKHNTSILQEAKLTTLSDELCMEYGGKMKANPKVELCAGAVKKNKNNKIFTYVIMHVYNYTFYHDKASSNSI